MPATVTLATTTLTAPVVVNDNQVSVASTSGLTPGTRLYVDRELMAVISLGVGLWVKVFRGVDGTATTDHAIAAVVTIGRADQFYSSDPVGRPSENIPVSPYINVIKGTIWYARGDATPTANRWWQEQTASYVPASFGGGTTATLDPTSST